MLNVAYNTLRNIEVVGDLPLRNACLNADKDRAYIVFVEFCHPLLGAARYAIFRHRVSHVIAASANEQMIGIHARWRIASMAYIEMIGHLHTVQTQRNARRDQRATILTARTDLTVPSVVDRCAPQPTRLGLLDLRPKA
jgi:hypothetical protein